MQDSRLWDMGIGSSEDEHRSPPAYLFFCASSGVTIIGIRSREEWPRHRAVKHPLRLSRDLNGLNGSQRMVTVRQHGALALVRVESGRNRAI